MQLVLQICVDGLRPDTSMLPPALRELVLDCLCVGTKQTHKSEADD